MSYFTIMSHMKSLKTIISCSWYERLDKISFVLFGAKTFFSEKFICLYSMQWRYSTSKINFVQETRVVRFVRNTLCSIDSNFTNCYSHLPLKVKQQMVSTWSTRSVDNSNCRFQNREISKIQFKNFENFFTGFLRIVSAYFTTHLKIDFFETLVSHEWI